MAAVNDMGVILMDSKRPKKRFKWTKRIAIALAVYTIVGFFVVPAVIKSQMLKRLPALTKRQAAVEQVKFNPYALSLTIRGFSLKEPDGEVFVSFDEFYVNFELWASLFKRSWVFKKVLLGKPFAQISYKEDGTFNFANLVDTTEAPPLKSAKLPGPPPSVRIYNLSITNGGLALADLVGEAGDPSLAADDALYGLVVAVTERRTRSEVDGFVRALDKVVR